MTRVFIVNPNSGSGKADEIAKALMNICREDKLDSQFFYTNEKGDAKDFSDSYKNIPGNIIYCVGGDGTLNEVVNGMVKGKNSLVVIPAGTGNDFCKMDLFNRKIDIGKVNDQYFINIASIGMDASVAQQANIYKEQNIKGNIYIKAAIKTLFNYKEPEVFINDQKHNLNILAVCNGKYYGDGIKIAPEACAYDGLFDICLVSNISSLIHKGVLFSKLLKGKHLENNKVKYYRDDKLQLTSNVELICNVDGEIIKSNKFDFSIVKDAIYLKEEDNPKIRNLIKRLT